jgi:hypothetical protein
MPVRSGLPQRGKPGPKPTSTLAKSKRGHGQRLTLLDRFEIVNLKRLHPDWSARTLAEAVKCRPETVRLVLLASNREIVELMAASGSALLDDWRQASALAAVRGDHRPAKDWLLHSGLIDPVPDSQRSAGPAVVIINAPLPGMPGALPVLEAQVRPADAVDAGSAGAGESQKGTRSDAGPAQD